MRPLLLDLFCGAGGASAGYRLAGFDVIGVDLFPQKHYPYEFRQQDALEELDRIIMWGNGRLAAIHASPPCQGYSKMNSVHKREYPMLIEPVRDALKAIGVPYVIENVEGAPLHTPVTLCGTMFGLKVIRHRLFETNFPVNQPKCNSHVGEFYSPAGHGDPNWRHREKNPHLRGKGYTDRCRAAMGIDWMNRDELAESIPPAYTNYIGVQLMGHLQ